MEGLEIEDSASGFRLVHVEVDVFAAGVDGSLDNSRIHKDFVALGVDEVSLLIENVVIFKQVLSDIEVTLLDTLLCAFDYTADHRVLQRLAAVHSQSSYHGLQAVLCKETQQCVVEAHVEAGCSRVSLTACTSSELVVDTSRFVALGAQDVETAKGLYFLVVGFPLVVSLFSGNL